MAIDSKTYYDEHQADPRSEYDEIKSGLREYSIQSCQYWIKGLSALCTYWDNDATVSGCTYMDQFGSAADISFPSGYNSKNCDYLGRRYKCDKYVAAAADNLDQYWCVAPNMFLTGLGKHSVDSYGKVLLVPIPKTEIAGYCDGRCDEQGRGTGCEGTPGSTPIVCGYYRPFQMGFGADEPHGIDYYYDEDKNRVIEADAIDRAYAAAVTPMEKRLPFSFKIYNLRAHFQNCANWEGDTGVKFQSPEGDQGIHLDIDPADYCKSQSESAIPYYTISTPGSLGINQWLLEDVWCDGQTVVCNGAKPECPCYTGKWHYLTDEKMQEGMRITANQIFELRFWVADWGSQAEYEEFFLSKPNFGDATTTSIYTFSKLEKLSLPEDSKMIGNKLDMCVPALMHLREFDPDVYITTEEVHYPKNYVDPGTTAPENQQVYFPSLIRDPDIADMYVIPLNITYPYPNIDPFNDEVSCEDRGDPICIKKTCRIEGYDELTVVGSTLSNKTIYVINLNYYGTTATPETTVTEFTKYYQVSAISNIPLASPDADPTLTGLSPRQQFFIRLENFIDYCDKIKPEGIVTGTSDNYGNFKIDPVHLEVNKTNKVVICVKYDDGSWDFRRRDVYVQWYGGIILQNKFTSNYHDSGYDGLPEIFFKPAEIEGTVKGLWSPPLVHKEGVNVQSSVSSFLPVNSRYYLDQFGADHYEYSYCIKKKTVETTTTTWARIGNTGMIWMEMPDINLNNIFEWGITSAKMVRVESQDEELEQTCMGVGNEVEMEVVDIETFISSKLSVPPNVRILQPEDDILVGFFPSDWSLSVTYWYKYMSDNDTETDDDVIEWPDFTDSSYTFVESNISVETTDVDFLIGGIREETAAVMAFFVDEDQRIVSCMASKLLVQVAKVECRNVEIKYDYIAPAVGWRIMPETSESQLANERWPDLKMEEPFIHSYTPPCGDHRLSNITGKGPCWFPFSLSCEGVDFYREYSPGGFCTNDFPETPREDMRMCGPPTYKAFTDPGGGLQTCLLPYHYRYSVCAPSDVLFTGYANIVHWVNMLEYLAEEDWNPPPFGNNGREMVTRWLSQDHWAHLSYKDTITPTVRKQWVPLVPDKGDFFVSFNAFDESSEITPDNFNFVSQLNFLLRDAISESIAMDGEDYARVKFEDVFGIHAVPFTSYPPLAYSIGSISRVAFYYFKNTNTTWAWREIWKDIEYWAGRTFNFVSYERPDYVYGYDKDEYRYICDEGYYSVYFEAPVIEGTTLTKYPSIKLGDAGEPRYFEIRYDNYDSEYVDWQDEDSGEVDGSGGDAESAGDAGDEGNIYEQTSGSDWSHDENIIFDQYAVKTKEEAEAAGRKYDTIDPIEGLISTYFNRGIISHITKDKLRYMPYEETLSEIVEPIIDVTPADLNEFGTDYAYSPHYNNSPTYTYTYDETDIDAGGCISKVLITGVWGFIVEKNVCKPGIIITADGTELYNLEAVAFDKDIFSDKLGAMQYRMEIEVSIDPKRMIELEEEFKVQLIGATGQWVAVNNFELYLAKYISTREDIRVWERKYNYSQASKASDFGDFPPNGPKVSGQYPLQYEVDNDNAGVYFPASPQVFPQFWGETAARDKMRSIFASEQYTADEVLDVTVTNLPDIEEKEQQILYQDAYFSDIDGDTVIYTGIIAPPFVGLFNALSIPVSTRSNISFYTQKIDWTNHLLARFYTRAEPWQPGGHKYQWNDRVEWIFCYEIALGHVQGEEAYKRHPIYSVDFYHLDAQTTDLIITPPNALRWGRLTYQLDVSAKLYGESAWANITGSADPLALADTIVDTPVVGAGGGVGGVPVTGARG